MKFYNQYSHAYLAFSQKVFGENGLFKQYEKILEKKSDEIRFDLSLSNDKRTLLYCRLKDAETNILKQFSELTNEQRNTEYMISKLYEKEVSQNINILLEQFLSTILKKDFVISTLPFVFEVFAPYNSFKKEKAKKYMVIKKECVIRTSLAQTLTLNQIDSSADVATMKERCNFQDKLQKCDELFFSNFTLEENIKLILPLNNLNTFHNYGKDDRKFPIVVKLKRNEDDEKIFPIKDKQLVKKLSYEFSHYFWEKVVSEKLIFDFCQGTSDLIKELDVADKEKYVENILRKNQESNPTEDESATQAE